VREYWKELERENPVAHRGWFEELELALAVGAARRFLASSVFALLPGPQFRGEDAHNGNAPC
jgi:hypothetical protein